MAANRCASCGGPRSPGSIVKTPGHEGWCTWCESIDQVTAAQNEAFKSHDHALAQQRAQAANTYRRSGEINPAWIATIVVFVFLAIMRVACR
jgi:hypothetical protein